MTKYALRTTTSTNLQKISPGVGRHIVFSTELPLKGGGAKFEVTPLGEVNTSEVTFKAVLGRPANCDKPTTVQQLPIAKPYIR